MTNYAGDFKLLQDFDGSVLAGSLAVLTRAVLDLIYSSVQIWLAVLGTPDAFTFQSKIEWFAFAAGVVLSALFALFHPIERGSGTAGPGFPRSLPLFGLWSFLVGALPIWLTSKQLSGGGRWDDRFTLAPMLGAGLLTVAFIMWFIRARQRRLLLTVLLGLSH
jgi:hypothetical protein